MSATPRGLSRAALAWVGLVAVLSQSWTIDLPFQLDDFLLVADPWALFHHVDRMASDDVPAFMCRIPMWIAWGLVHAVTPEPLSPVPFHLFGLLLHATAAVLLARVVGRHAPEPFARGAGLSAGLAFGAMAGAMQAVSWIAAWSSLLYTIFSLAALNVALDGRARPEGARWRSAAGAGLLLYLAIITKVPAIVAAAVVLGVLVLTALRPGARRRLLVELAWSVGAIGMGMLTRSLFLGTRHLRYEERVEPGLGELPGIIASGFHALGQALYPWNRDPLFNGEEPLIAGLGLGAPWIALLVCLPIALVAIACAGRARRPILMLALLLVPAVVPPGVIYEGQPTNVVSREAYLPLAVAAALLGVSVGALLVRRRAFGVTMAAVLGLLILDGTRHVAHTERRHGEELRAVRALLDELAAEPRGERELLVLALMPDGGFAGIPSLGGLLPLSHRPPFVREPTLAIETFRHPAYLADRLSGGSAEAATLLATRDVILIGPECDADLQPLGPSPELSGALNRERRLLRRLTPIRRGLGEGASTELSAMEGGVWRPDAPLPAHAVGALELTIDAPVAGGFEVIRGDAARTLAVRADPRDGARLVVGLPTDPAARLGPPIEAVRWLGEAAPSSPLRARASLPELRALLPAAGADLDIGAFRDVGPAFRVTSEEPDLNPGAFARLELRFDLLGWVASVYSDRPGVEPNADLRPAQLHLEPTSPVPIPAGAPWSLLPEERILPRLLEGDLNGATFRWRVTYHHEDGAPAARSPFRAARFVVQEAQ